MKEMQMDVDVQALTGPLGAAFLNENLSFSAGFSHPALLGFDGPAMKSFRDIGFPPVECKSQ